MAKPTFEPNPKVELIFNDLEVYLEFCKDYGYRYDEATLGDMRDYVFRQFNRSITDKPVKDGWAELIAKTFA